jgi:hypothetical protein
MITFEALYEAPSTKPTLAKVISLGGEEYKQRMMFSSYDEEEMDTIPTSVILQHLDNLVSYMQNVSLGLRVVGLAEPKPEDAEYIVGINDLWWAKDEARSWWVYARSSREPEDL